MFRFGNPLVDDWEGRVNAWPLDEGLIDYVKVTNYYPTENDFANFNSLVCLGWSMLKFQVTRTVSYIFGPFTLDLKISRTFTLTSNLSAK